MPTIATRWRLDATGFERHGNPVQARYPGRLQRSMTVGIVIVIRADLTDYAGGAASGWQEGVRTLRHQMLASSQHQLHPGRGSGPVTESTQVPSSVQGRAPSPGLFSHRTSDHAVCQYCQRGAEAGRAARRRRAHCGPPDEGRETVVVGVSRCSSSDRDVQRANDSRLGKRQGPIAPGRTQNAFSAQRRGRWHRADHHCGQGLMTHREPIHPLLRSAAE
jgi:hypothetical protein